MVFETHVLEHRIILFLLKQLWHSAVNLCKKSPANTRRPLSLSCCATTGTHDVFLTNVGGWYSKKKNYNLQFMSYHISNQYMGK